jgi:hypothetical protein
MISFLDPDEQCNFDFVFHVGAATQQGGTATVRLVGAPARKVAQLWQGLLEISGHRRRQVRVLLILPGLAEECPPSVLSQFEHIHFTLTRDYLDGCALTYSEAMLLPRLAPEPAGNVVPLMLRGSLAESSNWPRLADGLPG